MSTDYDIKCRDCGCRIEGVASSSIAYGDKLWTGPTHLNLLRDFLFAHQGHVLVFVGENHSEHSVNEDASPDSAGDRNDAG